MTLKLISSFSTCIKHSSQISGMNLCFFLRQTQTEALEVSDFSPDCMGGITIHVLHHTGSRPLLYYSRFMALTEQLFQVVHPATATQACCNLCLSPGINCLRFLFFFLPENINQLSTSFQCQSPLAQREAASLVNS